MLKKIFTIAIFLPISILLVSYLWQVPSVLIPLIILTAILKHLLSPIPKELLTFIVVGILGPLMESLMMLSGPWSYASPNLFNFPIWLPFLWGLAGTIVISLYEILKKTKSF